MKAAIGALVIFISSVALADNHEHKPAKVSPEFESMKALVGTWEGKAKVHGKDETVKVVYELTSGGTTIVEKLGPGTPMEMVTVYSSNGKTTSATHYCMAGNQPQLALKNAKGNSFTFEMVGTNGIADANEMHMHAVTLTVKGNKLKQEWTSYKDGKKGEMQIFELTKKI